MKAVHTIILVLFAALLFAGCYKDEVAESDLTSNALDPDYDGPPILELISTDTELRYNGFVVIDTVVVFNMRVRTDLFPSLISYQLEGVQTNDGTSDITDQLVPTTTEASVEHRHVLYGNTYCMDISVVSVGSNSRSYRFCGTAVQ